MPAAIRPACPGIYVTCGISFSRVADAPGDSLLIGDMSLKGSLVISMNISHDLSQCVTRHLELIGRSSDAPVQEFHLGFGVDAAFVRALGVLLTSLCENNRQLALTFHVLAIALDADDIDRFRALAQSYQVNIHIYDIDTTFFAGLPTKRELPIPIYFRFILPSLVAAQTILYLDSDILCLQTIQPLLSISLGENVVAAVFENGQQAKLRMAALNIPSYFNSGVLLIDIENWKKAHVNERALTFLFETGEKHYYDQDALNVVLEGHTRALDKAWNYLLDFHRYEDSAQEALQHARLLHFISRPKPWSIAYDCQCLLQRYREYALRSPWADIPPQLPDTYREARYYAEHLWRKRRYTAAMAWYLRYLRHKFCTHR
jgi:lipopolysaccharide biosynthesis glycosyltransferase